MENKIVILLIVAVIFGTPAVIMAGGQKEEAVVEGVTIRFINQNAEYDKYIERAIDEFEKMNPGIEVSFPTPSFAWDGYWQNIQNLYAAGNPPDVLWMSIAYTSDYAKKVSTLSLDDYVGKDMDKYYTKLLDLERYPYVKGKLYAMPYHFVESLLFYNKDMFDAAGINYPDSSWDYEKLIEVSKKLTRDAEGGKEYGFFANGSHTFLDAMINAYGGEVLSADRKTCKLTDPTAIKVIQKVVDMIHVDHSAPVSASYDALLVSAGEMFQSGKIAMTIDGSYMIESFRESAFNWDAAMIPKGPVKRVIYGGPDGNSIASATKHPDEAWKWIEFLSGPNRPMETWIPGGIPILKSSANSQEWYDMHSKWLSDPEVMLDSAEFIYHDWSSRWFEWRNEAMNAELALAFVGQKDVEEAARAAKVAIEKIIR